MAAISTLSLARAGGGVRLRRIAPPLALLGVPILLWPALYNGFPIIFSDTGTYLSQILERHLGWDRPPFYSLFLAVTGWGRSGWPPVILQTLCATLLIGRTRMCIQPRGGIGDLAILAVLGAVTSLPWTASELMPDLFTPLLVLGLFLLIFDDGLRGLSRAGLALLLSAIMTVHLTNLPLYLGLCLVILPARLWRGDRGLPPRLFGHLPWRLLVAAPALAAAALMTVNLAGTGRASLSPYGATFYLARLLADGPARLTLAADCPHERWALCADQAAIPRDADAFLWNADSPLYREGGPKALIGQTGQIIRHTVAEHPGAVLRDAAADTLRQLAMFRDGDGLEPWPLTAGATIRRDFPAAAVAAFDRSRQETGRPLLPRALRRLDLLVETFGLFVTLIVLGGGLAQRHGGRLPWLAAMTLLALLGNAILTGCLSGPHDRYQSRVMWLPVLVTLLAIPYARRGRWSRPARTTR